MTMSNFLGSRVWLLLAALCTSVPAIALPVDLELVLAVDISGSVDEEEGQLQRDGYVQAFRDPRVLEAIRSGFHGRIAVNYIEWADVAVRHVVMDWQLVSDAASAARVADLIATAPKIRGRYTSISGAIELAAAQFAKNDFESRRMVIDISGDGANNNGGLVTGYRDKAVAAGITINGLPIVNDRPGPFGQLPMRDLDEYYRNCVIGGPWAFIVVAEGFQSFANAVRRKLLIEIGGGEPPAEQPKIVLDASNRVAGLTPVALRGGMEDSFRPLNLPIEQTAATGGPPCDIGERQLGGGILR